MRSKNVEREGRKREARGPGRECSVAGKVPMEGEVGVVVVDRGVGLGDPVNSLVAADEGMATYPVKFDFQVRG